MFQEQLKELVELGKGFVSAMNTLTKAVAEESTKQIDIIREAHANLAYATQVQVGIIGAVDTISNAMDDIYNYADEVATENNIVLERLDEAFEELDEEGTDEEEADAEVGNE
jgi:translation initiation factor 2B subunit (eIF-2B alpha/beta/delta family)